MATFSLWLPIIVSGVVVFMASFLAWMVLPHHKADWKKFSDEDGFLKAVSGMNLEPGQYMYPHATSNEEMKSEAFQARMKQGPWGTLAVWSGTPQMGKNILLTFAFFIFTSYVIAYLAAMVLPPGESFIKVFRFVGTVGVMTYCFALVQGAIWFKRKILNDVLDGIVYGLLTGVVFALLWPGA